MLIIIWGANSRCLLCAAENQLGVFWLTQNGTQKVLAQNGKHGSARNSQQNNQRPRTEPAIGRGRNLEGEK